MLRRWLLALAAGALALTGCAPGTPDADSWRIDAQRALGDAASAAAAAQVALQQHSEGRLFDAYLPLIRYEQQPGVGLAIRKEILHRRGILASPALRPPGPKLGPEDAAELDLLLERLDRRMAGSGGT